MNISTRIEEANDFRLHVSELSEQLLLSSMVPFNVGVGGTDDEVRTEARVDVADEDEDEDDG